MPVNAYGARAAAAQVYSCARVPQRLHRRLSCSASSSLEFFGEECKRFLPWLRTKSGAEISSVLNVGVSVYGRSLFASKHIEAGDSILKQITQDNLKPEIKDIIDNNVGNVSKLAIVLLREKALGQDSEWAPYINILPCINQMHNTLFWSDDELEMIRQSPVYCETHNQKAYIEKEFAAIKQALGYFPVEFEEPKLADFIHAYALVGSRAWEASKGLSLVRVIQIYVPFADFMNHNGLSEALLLSDEDKEISEVIADQDYAVGEQVFIRYGKFPNTKLLIDFGFTVPHNIYDQVDLSTGLEFRDPLFKEKKELLQKHQLLKLSDADSLESSRTSFKIKEVKSASGKGIPQALRAFTRVASASSKEELQAMASEAAENDGRLARRALKIKDHELQAHLSLLSCLRLMINDHSAAIKDLLGLPNSFRSKHALRKKMARDLLAGELRVLKSATDWLANYCANM